jgi:hypothetical protein
MVVLVYQHRTNHENKTHNFNYNIVEKKCVIAVTKHRDAINNFNLTAFFACLKTGPGFNTKAGPTEAGFRQVVLYNQLWFYTWGLMLFESWMILARK